MGYRDFQHFVLTIFMSHNTSSAFICPIYDKYIYKTVVFLLLCNNLEDFRLITPQWPCSIFYSLLILLPFFRWSGWCRWRNCRRWVKRWFNSFYSYIEYLDWETDINNKLLAIELFSIHKKTRGWEFGLSEVRGVGVFFSSSINSQE